jgi:hypothetical protein
MGGEHVAGKRFVRVRPRITDVRNAGEVIDGRRPGFGCCRRNRVAVLHFHGRPSHAAAFYRRAGAGPQPCDDVDLIALEQFEQVAADEAGGPGDQDGVRGHYPRLLYCASM